MADQLLIRSFDVEVGDCFYVRIPQARVLADGSKDDFHLLIDCGTKGSQTLLRAAITLLAEELPEVAPGGKRRLDLLIVTHEHQDHIKGFDPGDFEAIQIEDIWLTAGMNDDHPQAEKTHELHGFAARAMQDMERQGVALSPEIRDLVSLFSINNDGALRALKKDLLKGTGKTTQYVHAGMTSKSLKLALKGATFKILAPEQDIDRFYLGEEADQRFQSLSNGRRAFREASRKVQQPSNISPADFHGLRSRMLSNALAFADLASRVKNNTSVVLLIEWAGRRLLFVGDAEWEHSYREGKKNGSWNVMWKKRRRWLDKPLDFLKIGHHGSTNSTPWDEGKEDPHGAASEPAQILDAILPRPAGGQRPTAQALVSTRRKNYKTIPKSELLAEIGRRVMNTRRYFRELEAARKESKDDRLDPLQLPHFKALEEAWLDEPQPLRTDLETLLHRQPWIDVRIDPAP